MRIIKALIISASLSSLSACGGSAGLPSVNSNPTAPVVAPRVTPMDLSDVHWTVRDLAGLKALVAQMEATGQTNAVFYILDQDSYNALAMNIAEVRRYINDQRASKEFLEAAIAANQKPYVKSEQK